MATILICLAAGVIIGLSVAGAILVVALAWACRDDPEGRAAADAHGGRP